MNKLEEIAKDQKLDLIINGVEKSNLLAQKLLKIIPLFQKLIFQKPNRF